jgi:hypothetical protein
MLHLEPMTRQWPFGGPLVAALQILMVEPLPPLVVVPLPRSVLC